MALNPDEPRRQLFEKMEKAWHDMISKDRPIGCADGTIRTMAVTERQPVLIASVAGLADAQGLGSCSARSGGSNPSARTNLALPNWEQWSRGTVDQCRAKTAVCCSTDLLFVLLIYCSIVGGMF